MFQNFNLFPHLTALGNVIEAPLTVKKMARPAAEALGRHYLDRVGLSGKEQHYPAQLFGRPAAARRHRAGPGHGAGGGALRRAGLRARPEEVATLLRVLDDLKKTLVVVSHDMDFARAISDQVIYFEGGRAVESGTASAVFGSPAQPETRAFIDSFHGGRAQVGS